MLCLVSLIQYDNIQIGSGIWSDGWVSNVRLRNIFGYINERSLIHAETKYDWLIDGVMSQADGNYGKDITDAPIYLATNQDVTLRQVTIASIYSVH